VAGGWLGIAITGAGKSVQGMRLKGDVEHGLEIQVETFVDWELRSEAEAVVPRDAIQGWFRVFVEPCEG
jgi:hypothetical protein